MVRLAAILILASSLAGCGVVDTLMDGVKHSNAVAHDLEQTTGLKPEVGFNWKNGRLNSVTVTFPALYEAKPLHEIAETVRMTVAKEFKQAPGAILLGFSVSGTAPGTTAQR